ncbi:MAG: hypothetical protein R6U95_10360, partial [Bacteroidales bacterium]
MSGIVAQATQTIYTSEWNITTDETIPLGDTVVLQDGLHMANGVTLTNNGVIRAENNLVINRGTLINEPTGIIEIEDYDITFTTYNLTGDADKGTHFENNGVLRGLNSDFLVYPQSSPYSIETGVTVKNAGVFDFEDCEFVVRGNNYNPWSTFENVSNALVIINNKNSEKQVNFGEPDGGVVSMQSVDDQKEDNKIASVHIQEQSNFYIKNADLNFELSSSENYIDGNIIVEDGNVNIISSGGGVSFILNPPFGGMYVFDTDDSQDDGMINISEGGGGSSFRVDGELYSTGIITENVGGGNGIVVSDQGLAYVGNLGASMVDQFSITVKDGGTLNYCGNLTPNADDVGTIEDGGMLNYAQSFYDDDPNNEEDFAFDGTVDASMNAMYSDSAECVSSFNQGVETVLGEALEDVLPIELSSLSARCKYSNMHIEWQTLTEDNNSHFTLYRSFNGVDFDEIAVVLGAGVSREPINYEYVDYIEKASGVVYYKLAQTDFDGETSYSHIIMSQTCGSQSDKHFFTQKENEIIVDFISPYAVNYVVVTSLNGKIVYTKQFAGKKQAVIPLFFDEGIYIITNYTQNYTVSQKFVHNNE